MNTLVAVDGYHCNTLLHIRHMVYYASSDIHVIFAREGHIGCVIWLLASLQSGHVAGHTILLPMPHEHTPVGYTSRRDWLEEYCRHQLVMVTFTEVGTSPCW